MISDSPNPPRSHHALWTWGLLILLPLAIFYSGRGLIILARGHTGRPDDFARRWREERYVIARINPYDVLFTRDRSIGRPLPTSDFRTVPADPAVGGLDTIGYPPWTYFSGLAFHSARLPWGRWQYAVANLIALVAITLWALGEAPPRSAPAARWFLPVCCLATMPFFCTLTYGQYGVLLIALLAWSARLSGTRRWWVSALLMGVAMLKPSVTLAFLLVPLRGRRGPELFLTAAYVALAGLAVCAWTRTDPHVFMLQMRVDSERYVLDAPGLLKAAVVAGVPLRIAMPGLMLVLLAAAFLWIREFGGRETVLDQLAIAGLTARIFTYHRPYDDLLLVFLLVALTARLIKRPTTGLLAGTFLVGLSLWLPLGFGWKWPFAAMQHLCWFAGAAILTADVLERAVCQQRSRLYPV